MSELPESWVNCTLQDVGDIVSGGTPSTKNPDFWGEYVPWISPSDLTGYTEKFIRRGAKSLTELGLKNSSAKLMPAGSVHFSSRAPIGYVAVSTQSLCTNQGFKSLVPAPGIFNEYIYFYLKSIRGLANSLATGTTFKELSGKAFAKLPLPLPPLAEQKRIVAKIEELFSELDAGEESLRRARRQLGVYRQSLLKQAFEGKLTEHWRLSARKRAQAGAQVGDVVPEARDSQWFTYIIECDGDSYYVGSTRDLRERWRRHCEGTGADWTKANPPRYLVHFETFASEAEARKRERDLKTGFGRTWRKREVKAGRIKPLVHNANNPATEPVQGEPLQTGDQLLARIQAERQARYQQQLKEWEDKMVKWEAESTGERKPTKPKQPSAVSAATMEDARELPIDWLWLRLDDVSEVSGGLTKNSKRDRLPLRILYLRVANVYANELRLDEIKDIGVPPLEAKKVRLVKGDLLIVEGNGSLDQIGRVASWDGSIAECGHQNHLIRARCLACADYSFTLLFLLSPQGRELIEKQAASTSGLHTLSVSKVQNLPVPLCSLPEQQEIVRLLDEQFEVIEQNEREIDAALKRSEALRQSILKKAFTGHLLPPACRQAGKTPPTNPPPPSSPASGRSGKPSLREKRRDPTDPPDWPDLADLV